MRIYTGSSGDLLTYGLHLPLRYQGFSFHFVTPSTPLSMQSFSYSMVFLKPLNSRKLLSCRKSQWLWKGSCFEQWQVFHMFWLMVLGSCGGNRECNIMEFWIFIVWSINELNIIILISDFVDGKNFLLKF